MPERSGQDDPEPSVVVGSAAIVNELEVGAVESIEAHMAALTILFLLFLSGCSDPDGQRDADTAASDGDGDTDVDADGDVDHDGGDGDADQDVPHDADPDIDPDVEAGPVEMTIVTWNIENFPQSASTVTAVAELVQQLDIDVLAIQEIDEPPAFDDLLDELPGYDGVLNNDNDGYIRLGLVYRTEGFAITDVQTLYPRDTYIFPRPPLAATVQAFDDAGVLAFDFKAIVVHLKAQIDAESRERRRSACERLSAWIAEERDNGGEDDFIVLGDWNDELTDWGDQNIFEAFLNEDYTFLTMELAEQGAYSYLPFRSFLDHILVTSGALDEYGDGVTEVLALEQTVDRYEQVISDHRPVQARFFVE